jgi:hypothetical protein
MNPELNTEETAEVVKETNPVFTVTKTSKYLALLLFILLPFIGGYIGYTYAPEKVVESIVVGEVVDNVPSEVEINEIKEQENVEFAQKNLVNIEELGIAGGTTVPNGRYVLHTTKDLTTLQVFDLEEQEIIFEDDVGDTGSLNSTVCHIGYPNAATNFNFSKDGNAIFYGVYSDEKIDDCEFKLLETREYIIAAENKHSTLGNSFSIQHKEGESNKKTVFINENFSLEFEYDPEQFRIANESDTGMSVWFWDSLEKNKLPFISLDAHHKDFCLWSLCKMEVKEVVRLGDYSWEYIGGFTRNDGSETMFSDHVYLYRDDDIVLYLRSDIALHTGMGEQAQDVISTLILDTDPNFIQS